MTNITFISSCVSLIYLRHVGLATSKMFTMTMNIVECMKIISLDLYSADLSYTEYRTYTS